MDQTRWNPRPGEGNHVREAAQETGFIRPQEDGTLELVLAHNTGFVETWYGEIHAGPKLRQPRPARSLSKGRRVQ